MVTSFQGQNLQPVFQLTHHVFSWFTHRQVLSCLALLVNVLGGDSHATYPLLLPLLQEALHPDSTQPELLEDGLALWLVAVRNAPSPEAGAALLELTPALTACLSNSTGESMSVCCCWVGVSMCLLCSCMKACACRCL